MNKSSPVDLVINPSLMQLEKKQEELMILLKNFEEKRDKLNMIISEKRGAIGVLRVLTSTTSNFFNQQPQIQMPAQMSVPAQISAPSQMLAPSQPAQMPAQQQEQAMQSSKSFYKTFNDPAPFNR